MRLTRTKQTFQTHTYFSGSALRGVPHLTLILAAWKLLAARNVKSTAIVGSLAVNITVTGAVVPGVNAGIITVAFIGVPTTVNDCNPLPAFTWSIVTEPGPLDTPKDAMPPGNKSPSVTVEVGVQVSAQRTRINAA